MSKRNFRITANQYDIFRFVITRRTAGRVLLAANAPVNLVLLDSEDRADFERDKTNYTYTEVWNNQKFLDEAIRLDPGTWYLLVEGRSSSSRGWVEVLER